MTSQDLIVRCKTILTEANKQNVLLRVIGGVAIYLHSPVATSKPELSRNYGDLDFVTASPDDKKLRNFFEGIGYLPNARFNALYGKNRMLFFWPDSEIHIDIFINRFRMCHTIDFPRSRLLIDSQTIPLAELLLSKLQIVQINPKDIKDIVALLLEHELGTADREMINLEQITKIVRNDWGFYTTITLNLQKIKKHLIDLKLTNTDKITIENKVDTILNHIQRTPKTLKWKIRNIFGTSIQWYEEPEDAVREAITELK